MVGLRSKLAVLMIVSLGLILVSTSATAQSVEDEQSYMEPEVFECEPGEVPSTSIIEKSKRNLRNLLGMNRGSYPGECKSWTEEYVIEEDEYRTEYVIEVLKYAGDEWDAIVAVQRDGSKARYVDVEVDGSEIGVTNAHGMTRTDLPENFSVIVDTSDGEFELMGRR